MRQSESIKTLLQDFTKAQSEFPTLPKDKNGYNYKYSDLDTVITTVRPILAKYNLGFMQSLTTLENGRWAITVRLFNASGEWIEDTTPLPDVSLAKGNAAQNVGAAITYMKRYTLCAMLGISSDEDPDGKPDGNPDFNARNKSQNNNPAPQNNARQNNRKPPVAQPKGGPDTPEQKEEINRLLSATYSDGTPIFNQADFNTIGQLRTQFTAPEVIQKIKNESITRINAKAGTKPQEFPEDLPYDNNPFPEDPKAEPADKGAEQAFEIF